MLHVLQALPELKLTLQAALRVAHRIGAGRSRSLKGAGGRGGSG